MKVNFEGLFDALQIARAEAQSGRLHMRRWLDFRTDAYNCDRSELTMESGCSIRRLMKIPAETPAEACCPTAACMVGSYAISKGLPLGNWLKLGVQIAGNERLSSFLFTNHMQMIGVFPGYRLGTHRRDAATLEPAEAIRRLEKTIAYLNRKQSMWETEPERMRHQEGDWGFVSPAAGLQVEGEKFEEVTND